MTLWGGRFTGKLDPAAWELNASLPVDRRLAMQDVRRQPGLGQSHRTGWRAFRRRNAHRSAPA